MNRRNITLVVLLAVSMTMQADNILTLTSPDGVNVVWVEATEDGFAYSVRRHGRTVIEPSRLGLEMDNRHWERALAQAYPQYDSWMQGFQLDSVSRSERRDTIRNFYGEQATVPDCYNAATIHLSKHDGSRYRLDIQLRVYDEGVAFRYFIPEHPQAVFHKVVGDLTEYSFAEGTKVWAAEWAQAPYALLPVDSVRQPIERAVTVELQGSGVLALADADASDWCLMQNVASTTKAHTLATTMYSPVDVVTYAASPWHVILAADSYPALVERRYLIDNLNPPCAIADAEEWVRPGTIMRCTTLTTEAARRCIDFCAGHHIDYMLFDWKWYEPCTSHDGDATRVIPAIDMPAVVAYGRDKGVGIWLYVNQHALMRQARELFPLLREWGIVGVKSGFVEYASHRWATWLHDLVRLAAENHLMMNIHDEYRPTGFSRTYPNLLTQEGIRGNEEFPDARHNTILPFTRMVNGAADYTICYFDPRLKHTTHGHQLAASLTYYSPLVTLYWYDTPERIQPVPELAWFDTLPTTWDETRILDGCPGEYVVTARRTGSEWRVAVMNGTEARTITLPLDFLKDQASQRAERLPQGRYEVTLYEDAPDAATATHVAVRKQIVAQPEGTLDTSRNSKSLNSKSLRLRLQPSGGAVLIIKPYSASSSKK